MYVRRWYATGFLSSVRFFIYVHLYACYSSTMSAIAGGRTTCAVTLLFSVWLVGCDGTVEQSCRGDIGANCNACAAACEQQHPDGLRMYNIVMVTCVCESCDEACSQSVCGDKETPSDMCLPCVQESLGGDACAFAGHFGSCRSHADCAALVACLTACNP